MKEPTVTISIPSIPTATTTVAPTVSQASGVNNVLPSTTSQEHVTTSSTTVSSSQSAPKVEPADPTLQDIELQIQNINTKLKSLKTEREKLESEGTEEQHKKAMDILEKEQILERQHKEALFKQKQILNKQGVVDAKQKLGEPPPLQSQPNRNFKLALRLR